MNGRGLGRAASPHASLYASAWNSGRLPLGLRDADSIGVKIDEYLSTQPVILVHNDAIGEVAASLEKCEPGLGRTGLISIRPSVSRTTATLSPGWMPGCCKISFFRVIWPLAVTVGASSWANVMRARVGDVYMRWDATDKVPLFSAIPACPAQDSESPQDFLTGKVQKRTLNIPATANDCTQDGTKGALALARERLEAIAAKIRTKAPLSTEERHFVANVRTLPVYRMLEWGVRQGVVDSVIADTDELVALTLAYQMLNDLTRTIDFALTNAERGTNAAGATDGASPNICQTRILTKGIEQLRDLREEVLRQRAQMRQSYLAALNQANLSANYAGLLRQRDLDARNAAGAAATRNR